MASSPEIISMFFGKNGFGGHGKHVISDLSP